MGFRKLKVALGQLVPGVWKGQLVLSGVNCARPLVGGRDCQGSPWPTATADLCFQLVVGEGNHGGYVACEAFAQETEFSQP